MLVVAIPRQHLQRPTDTVDRRSCRERWALGRGWGLWRLREERETTSKRHCRCHWVKVNCQVINIILMIVRWDDIINWIMMIDIKPQITNYFHNDINNNYYYYPPLPHPKGTREGVPLLRVRGEKHMRHYWLAEAREVIPLIYVKLYHKYMKLCHSYRWSYTINKYENISQISMKLCH